MKVPKEVVPYLLDAVGEEIATALGEDPPENFWDPNDIIIFGGFVKPVLEDARERGFDSAEMLDKGFGFMIALIPSLLQRLGAGMPTRHFGMLARLYHLHTIEHALRRVRTMDDEWYWENIHYVNEELERARAIRPR